MYSLMRCLSLKKMLFGQVPVLVISFVIAEIFYKFHSFTLECGAFLATWFVLDWATVTLLKVLKPEKESPAVDKTLH